MTDYKDKYIKELEKQNELLRRIREYEDRGIQKILYIKIVAPGHWFSSYDYEKHLSEELDRDDIFIMVDIARYSKEDEQETLIEKFQVVDLTYTKEKTANKKLLKEIKNKLDKILKENKGKIRE